MLGGVPLGVFGDQAEKPVSEVDRKAYRNGLVFFTPGLFQPNKLENLFKNEREPKRIVR